MLKLGIRFVVIWLTFSFPHILCYLLISSLKIIVMDVFYNNSTFENNAALFISMFPLIFGWCFSWFFHVANIHLLQSCRFVAYCVINTCFDLLPFNYAFMLTWWSPLNLWKMHTYACNHHLWPWFTTDGRLILETP